jgi:hypothetical protein
MLQFLKFQFQSILALWDAGVFNGWYAYLLYAVFIGPVCSLIKIDLLIWNFFSSFDTKFNNFTNRVFNAFDVILDGSVWWLTINELFFQPFLLKQFNWRFLTVVLSVFLLKFMFGRKKPIKNGPPEPILSLKFNYDPFLKDKSKILDTWNFVWTRKISGIEDVFNNLFVASYPSAQLSLLFGLILFGQNNIGYIVLFSCAIIWKVVSNRNWFSDILSSVFLLLLFKKIFNK